MKNQKGFTLIELSIVMIIMAFMLLGIGVALKQYDLETKINTTNESIDTSYAAISRYIAEMERYPCPAEIDIPFGDPGFGVENCTTGDRRDSEDIHLRKNDANKDGLTDIILVGMVPITTILADLGAEDDVDEEVRLGNANIMDGWGVKLLYVVTENLTTEGYDKKHGAINLVDENSITIADRRNLQDGEFNGATVSDRNLPHMLLISHGRDRIGGYTLTSNTPIPGCAVMTVQDEDDQDGDGDTDEQRAENISQKENCDDDALFMAGIQSYGGVEGFTDDYVKHYITNETGLWLRRGGISDPKIIAKNYKDGGYIGIGIDNPAAPFHIDGSVRQDKDGVDLPVTGLKADAIRSDYICDKAETFCIEPSIISGTPTESKGILCPSGTVMYGISEGEALCEPVDFSKAQTGSCPEGQFVNGVSTIDGLICIDP